MPELFEILLVEDYEPDVRLLLRQLNASQISNKVHVVYDGAEALDFVFCRRNWSGRNLDHAPLVVILDIRLPKVDGWEVLRQLKDDQRTRGIPVIMISGSLFSGETERGREMGATAVLLKPVKAEELKKELSRCGVDWARA
jgi:two-component system, response regulator